MRLYLPNTIQRQMYFCDYRLTSEVEEWGVVLERREGERELRLRNIGVLECVPEGIARAEERATNFLPVALRVLDASDSSTRLRTD